jgi:RNA recognition motif-containing protein
VVTADVVTDRESGESRGFGFVVFANAEAVQDAIDTMDQQVRARWALCPPACCRLCGAVWDGDS